MARLTKSRKRKPIAIQEAVALSWASSSMLGASFAMSLASDEETASGASTFYRLDMSGKEAVRVVTFVAKCYSREEDLPSWKDNRSAVQALRDLADKLEAEGNMQSMGLTG